MKTIKIRSNNGDGWKLVNEIPNPYYPRFAISFFYKGENSRYIAFDNNLDVRHTAFNKKALFNEINYIINSNI